MKRKSYYRRIVIYFVLTLCIPIVTVLLLYVHSERAIRAQIELTVDNSLGHFLASIDTVMVEMRDIGIAVTESEKCKKYALSITKTTENKITNITQIVDELTLFFQNRYYDIFVYYPYEDRIVSCTKSSTTSWHYFNSYYSSHESYGKKTEQWDKFSRIINYDNSRPSFFSLKRDGVDYLCVAMKQFNFKCRENNYVAVVVLDPKYLEKNIGSSFLNQETFYGVYNLENELILSNQKIEDNVSCDKDKKELEYFVSVSSTKGLDGYYVCGISREYVFRQLLQLRITCGIGIVLCVLFSVLIAYRNSLRVWGPFETLYNRIEKRSFDVGGTQQVYDELAYIEECMLDMSKEKQQLQRKMQKRIGLQKEKVLWSLVKHSELDKDELCKKLQESDICLCYPSFYVCSIEIEYGPINWNPMLLLFIIANVLEEMLQNIGVGYVISTVETECLLLANVPQEISDEAFDDVLKQGKAFIENYYSIVLTFGISEKKKDIVKLSSAYRESCDAIQYRYIMGKGTFIHYLEIKNRKYQYDSHTEQNVFMLIMDYILSKQNKKSAIEFLEDMFKNLGINSMISLNTMQHFRYELLAAFYQMMNVDMYSTNEKKIKIEDLMLATDLDGLCLRSAELLEQILQEFRDNEKENDICSQAMQYIKDNYSNSALSLESIREALGCSGSYLSRKFKEKYGFSIIEFIHEQRILQAKKFLVETEDSVQMIAELTGYLSSVAFVKSFKKSVGIPPGEYRNTLYKTKANLMSTDK